MKLLASELFLSLLLPAHLSHSHVRLWLEVQEARTERQPSLIKGSQRPLSEQDSLSLPLQIPDVIFPASTCLDNTIHGETDCTSNFFSEAK